MKPLPAVAILLLCCMNVGAQKMHLTLFGGVSNYQGDLQSKRFTFQQANPAFGIGASYELTNKLSVRATLNFAKVKGDDKISRTDVTRNLNFSSAITDLHLGLEYDVLSLYEGSITPYVFGGVSVFHFNPATKDTSGRKVFLQRLGTEGQGFFMDRKKYSLNAAALAFGGGIKLALSENIRVRFEIGLRKTFTDYLDDISTTYAERDELVFNNGQLAADLAFRGDEDKIGLDYPHVNSIRGNPKSKDWYYFTGIGVSFRLSPLDVDRGGGRGRTGCPVNVY